MAKISREIFYLGKGGTGKTTLSALTAIALADKGYRVAIISLDPAHNLFDIFQVETANSSYQLQKNLYIEEIDTDFWLKKYLQSIEKQISHSYKYLTALSLEKNLQIIRYAPGLEEYALLFAYRAIKAKFSTLDFFIFDMPPTALAIRFFSLPGLSGIWLDQLIEIRRNILHKAKIIENIHAQDTKSTSDKVLNKLLQLQEENRQIQARFSDSLNSSIYIVLNEDILSVAESEDIQKKFASLKIKITGNILNKADTDIKKENQVQQFNMPALTARFGLYTQNPVGEDALNAFSKSEDFKTFISQILNAS